MGIQRFVHGHGHQIAGSWLMFPKSLADGGFKYVLYFLVVWNIFSFPIQLGISSSQLTNSNLFQRGSYTTNQPIYRFFVNLHGFHGDFMVI